MALCNARSIAAACFALAVAFTACGNAGDDSSVGGGTPDGAPPDGGAAATDGPTFGEAGNNTGQSTCAAGCPTGLTCNQGICDPAQGACATNADCEFDTYCSAGACVPYGAGGNDQGCHQIVPPGVFAPAVRCEFSTAPAGDPFGTYLDVEATPTVVNFDRKAQGNASIPSIVAPFTRIGGGYPQAAVLRILKGSDCSLVANLGGVDVNGDGSPDWVNSTSAAAAADLDGDGVPELVTYMSDATTVAFTRAGGAWKPLWPKGKATNANGTALVSQIGDSWASPSIYDLDGDGKPEVVREGYVINGQTGVLRAAPPPSYATYSYGGGSGVPPVVADLYGDGHAYLTTGAHVWKFDGASNAWTLLAGYEKGGTSAGFVALADFDPYDGKKAPEIAVASGGMVSIYALDHSVFMGMSVSIPGGGGGPPTIADYDHDGLPEVGVAGQDYYTVFDPDCQATPRTGGACADRTHCEFANGGACPDRILWSRHTQDHSSNVTGSSVFDFSGAGTPQVVYGDECFVRVFSGFDGSVLFSQYHSSCTWIENPVVADVTGDFHSEIVVGSNLSCGAGNQGMACGQLDANGVDTTFVGARCQADADCVSGKCDSGFCRCTQTAQCCPAGDDAKCLEAGTKCAPPPTGTPGTGNTCRAPHPHGLQGIRVYGDAKNRWVQSRQIWNQHAYAVTHVDENGTVPATGNWAANWSTSGLNNFRQNVPGEAGGNPLGDLTAQAGVFFTCSAGSAVFAEPVCNRGTAPVAAGVDVGFYQGSTQVCTASTQAPIDVGKCEIVHCTWTKPPATQSDAVAVTVTVDDGAGVPECDTGNDKGLIANVYCDQPR